jgi:RNA polymerase sigma-B factor
MDTGPMSLADTLGAPDPALDVVLDREAVKPQLCRLPERERRILYLRFFRGMTQSMIADQLGISQMHVSRLISRSCSTIRAEIAGDGEESGGEEGDGHEAAKEYYGDTAGGRRAKAVADDSRPHRRAA